MAAQNKGRERRGFGAVGPGERKKGTVTRRAEPAPARKAAAPPPRTVKAKAKVKGRESATFPTINISSKRVKISNIPIGAPVPRTIVFGTTTFTKKGK